MRKHKTVVNNNLILLIIILLLLFSTTVQAESKNGNQPLYSITRSQAILNVDMQNNTQEHVNKNMELKWKNNVVSNKDLEFKLNENLYLINDNDNNKPAGFVNHPDTNEDYFIPKNAIKVIINGYTYNLGTGYRKVLKKDVKSNQITFKVDISQLNKLPAGKYRAVIDTNLEIKGDKPKLLVNISEYFDINISTDNLNMTIENPTKEKLSNSVNWQISSNTNNYNVSFESIGVNDNQKDLTDEKNKNYFRYRIMDDKNILREFKPGEQINIEGIRSGDFKIYYSPDNNEDKDWYELNADEYHDTVVVTVSSN